MLFSKTQFDRALKNYMSVCERRMSCSGEFRAMLLEADRDDKFVRIVVYQLTGPREVYSFIELKTGDVWVPKNRKTPFCRSGENIYTMRREDSQ